MEIKSKKAKALDVRLCGAFAVILAVAVIGLLVYLKALGQTERHGINSVSPFVAGAMGILIIGVGTLLLKRWAAILLSLLSLVLASGMVWGIFEQHPASFELAINLAINFVFISILLIPPLSTIHSWKQLR